MQHSRPLHRRIAFHGRGFHADMLGETVASPRALTKKNLQAAEHCSLHVVYSIHIRHAR